MCPAPPIGPDTDLEGSGDAPTVGALVQTCLFGCLLKFIMLFNLLLARVFEYTSTQINIALYLYKQSLFHREISLGVGCTRLECVLGCDIYLFRNDSRDTLAWGTRAND